LQFLPGKDRPFIIVFRGSPSFPSLNDELASFSSLTSKAFLSGHFQELGSMDEKMF